jgi:transposase
MGKERGNYKCKRQLLEEGLKEEERRTLEEMSKHHRHGNFRRRALGILGLNAGRRVEDVSEILGVSEVQVYRWAKAWRERGLMGMLSGHKGGAPRKLTPELLDTAEEIARQEALTLGQIMQRVRERHPDAAHFSVDRLSVGLRERGLSFKRNRLSLKKTQ